MFYDIFKSFSLFMVTSHLSLLHLCSVSQTLLGWWIGCKKICNFYEWLFLHILILALRRFENNSTFTWDQKSFLAVLSIRSLSQPTKKYCRWNGSTESFNTSQTIHSHSHESHAAQWRSWLATFLIRFSATSAATFTKIIYTIKHMYIYYAPT